VRAASDSAVTTVIGSPRASGRRWTSGSGVGAARTAGQEWRGRRALLGANRIRPIWPRPRAWREVDRPVTPIRQVCASTASEHGVDKNEFGTDVVHNRSWQGAHLRRLRSLPQTHFASSCLPSSPTTAEELGCRPLDRPRVDEDRSAAAPVSDELLHQCETPGCGYRGLADQACSPPARRPPRSSDPAARPCSPDVARPGNAPPVLGSCLTRWDDPNGPVRNCQVDK
jgi:hypothetical protein